MKYTKKQKLELMGKLVDVTALYYGSSDNGYSIQKIKKRSGWVTGFSVIKEGSSEYDYEEGTTFTCSKTILVIKVRFWLNQKEVNVPYGHVHINPLGKPYPNQALYSWQYKKSYQDQKQYFPRDKKGRFIPVV